MRSTQSARGSPSHGRQQASGCRRINGLVKAVAVSTNSLTQAFFFLPMDMWCNGLPDCACRLLNGPDPSAWKEAPPHPQPSTHTQPIHHFLLYCPWGPIPFSLITANCPNKALAIPTGNYIVSFVSKLILNEWRNYLQRHHWKTFFRPVNPKPPKPPHAINGVAGEVAI